MLTQIEIGQRIALLRKRKDLSQEDLAKNINLSRSSLAQIELGNRSVDILELQKLAMVLEFTLDDFMSKDFKVERDLEIKAGAKPPKQEIRISVPTLNVEKCVFRSC